jgi:hypothetical protein
MFAASPGLVNHGTLTGVDNVVEADGDEMSGGEWIECAGRFLFGGFSRIQSIAIREVLRNAIRLTPQLRRLP